MTDITLGDLAVSHMDINLDLTQNIVTGTRAPITRVNNPIPIQRDSDVEEINDEDLSKDRFELETFTQCSKSHLWKLMMSFYDRKGPESWSQGIVPHFITCNAFIGRSYAQVLLGFLQDCLRPDSTLPLDVNEPLYIIELGTGSGKFSFYMLKALEEMQDVMQFPLNKIVYVMTDFTENNFNFWRDHPALKKYFENGMLEAGIFDAVNDNKIRLRSGVVIEKGSCKNPICVVANYLFDTLYHDIFQVENGELKEGLVSTGSKRKEEEDPLDPTIILRLHNQYKYVPISSKYYLDEGGDEVHFERILQWYKDCYHNNSNGASILLPIGALRALGKLTSFSNNRAIVISGDKGNNNPEQFIGITDPHIAVHGSFSLMVNYHAIGMWFTSKGGFALHNPQEEASLKVSCFVLNNPDNKESSLYTNEDWFIAPTTSDCSEGGSRMEDGEVVPLAGTQSCTSRLAQKDLERSKPFPHLKNAFHNAITIFGPNDFFVLQKSLKEDATNPPLKSVVSLLKLGDWDPDVFFKFRDSVLNQVPSCGQKLRNDLLRGVPRVWENYYMLDTDKDIAFEIGRFYYGIRDYANALKFYVESSKTVGEHHVTYHNQGLCYYSQGKLEIALELFVKSLAMNGEYEKARNWVDKVKRELAEKRIDSSIPSLVTSASNITILPTNDSNVILDTASAVINDVVNVVSANSISITSTEPNTTTSVQND